MPGTHSQDVNQNLLMPKCPARWARTPGWAKGQAVPAPLWRTQSVQAQPGTSSPPGPQGQMPSRTGHTGLSGVVWLQ